MARSSLGESGSLKQDRCVGLPDHRAARSAVDLRSGEHASGWSKGFGTRAMTRACRVPSVETTKTVLEIPPQPLDKDVVLAATLAVHADRDRVALQCAGEVVTCELATLSLRWGRLWSVLKISGRP